MPNHPINEFNQSAIMMQTACKQSALGSVVRLVFATAALLTLCTQAVAKPLGPLNLPRWEVLEFEKQAFWATAKSRLEIAPMSESTDHWQLVVESSVLRNSERVTIELDPRNALMKTKDRFSEGMVEKRLRSYTYMPADIKRERREPNHSASSDPADWPISTTGRVDYPKRANDTLITDAYMLPILASELSLQGQGASTEVLVHTDYNFYRVRLTTGVGIPVEVDYTVTGGKSVRTRRETVGVAMRVQPEGKLHDEDDFSFLGLSGDIIMLFDRDTRLLLQLRGDAPRIGTTTIDLKSVTLRPTNQ